MPQNIQIEPIRVEWDKGLPLFSTHIDFHFSVENGLAESQYVFLESNKLADRFKQNETSPSAPFTIVETGFGTGLNFLATYQLWLKIPSSKKPLHFISIEESPLSKIDLAKCLAFWPELKTQSDELIHAYPELIQGQHQIDLAFGMVKLTLIFSDVLNALKQYTLNCDCWFLDDFSPTKKPSMWSNALFKSMAIHSNKHTSFSSFNAISNVRKALISAGFDAAQKSGYGNKGEILFGMYLGNANTKPHIEKWLLPSKAPRQKGFIAHQTNETPSSNNIYDVIVLGAGLAGVSTAKSLADQGLKVAIIDQNSAPVLEASGQTQLAMYAKLSIDWNKTNKFITHCLAYSQRYYRCLQKQAVEISLSNNVTNNTFWHASGLLQVAWNEKELSKQARFISNCAFPESFIEPVSSIKASELSGLKLNYPGLWYPESGWLSPSPYANFCLSSSNINSIYNAQINAFDWNETSKSWKVSSKDLSFSATHLVIANSNQAKSFKQLENIPTKAIRGQLSAIKNKALMPCRAVICGEGYLCPSTNEWFNFGATFDLNNSNLDVTEHDLALNIKSLKTWLPGWLSDENIASSREGKLLKNNAGLRCSTPDYMPIVGQVPIYHEMIDRFASLRKDANKCHGTHGAYYPNLFINIGHGSKGVYSTPIAAELIRSQICGGSIPVSNEQMKILSPARFIIKHLKQRRI